jgi:hypothetical protein
MGFHASPTNGAFAVYRAGAKRALRTGLTKFEAWKEACRLARGSQARAYLHDKGGRIRVRKDYTGVSADE